MVDGGGDEKWKVFGWRQRCGDRASEETARGRTVSAEAESRPVGRAWPGLQITACDNGKVRFTIEQRIVLGQANRKGVRTKKQNK